MRSSRKKSPQRLFAVGFLFLIWPSLVWAEDPPNTNAQPVYIPGGLNTPDAAAAQLKAIQQAAGGAAAAPPVSAPQEVIPGPAVTAQMNIYGQFRNEDGSVKIEKQYLNRYRESVVRVIAKDNSGNELSRSMGTAVGKPPGRIYIAAPLSGILGNNLQWADSIEIVHHKGNKYKANVALIDEQLDLVLLDPANQPLPVTFIEPQNERAQIEVFTISFENDPKNPLKIKPDIHTSAIGAINKTAGTLSVSGDQITDNQAGTAIITKTNELTGMLLGGGQGVLTSALLRAVEKASKSPSISPRLVGVVMGRGVLVDPKLPGAFPTIASALDAIRDGRAPKADPRLYIPARTRELSPKEASRLVLKVMPGIYKERQPLLIPSNLSLTGSGPGNTTIIGNDPNEPIVSIVGQNNISISNFRLVPAALQPSQGITVDVKRSQLVIFLGNIIEAKGGTALAMEASANSALFGNTFPLGKQKAVQCRSSSALVEANAFFGAWPQAIAVDSGCNMKIQRNIFMENQISIASSSQAENLEVRNNNFIKSLAGIRFFGEVPTGVYIDNIFFQSAYAIFGSKEYSGKKIGKNSYWKSAVNFKGRPYKQLDMEMAQPVFEIPDQYDFRLKDSSPLVGAASIADEDAKMDIGAYQRRDCAGRWNGQLLTSIAAAVGEKKLATGCPTR